MVNLSTRCLAQYASSAARSGSMNSMPARNRAPREGEISNNAQATTALKRSVPRSSDNKVRTRWFGLRMVADTTCAPNFDMSTRDAVCPSTNTPTASAILKRSVRRVPRGVGVA